MATVTVCSDFGAQENKGPIDEGEKGEWKSWLETQS